jgi:hypothetical protein
VLRHQEGAGEEENRNEASHDYTHYRKFVIGKIAEKWASHLVQRRQGAESAKDVLFPKENRY